MAFQSHLYRRGASYVWRRRTPARAGGRILQISLRTNEPLIARRRAAIVTVESNNLFDAMSVQGVTVAEARKFLEFIIERERKKIAIFRADVRRRGDSESNQTQDWAMGTALRMIAQHGAGAAPLTKVQAEALHIEGCSAVEVSLLRENLENNVSLATSTPQDKNGGQIYINSRPPSAAKMLERLTFWSHGINISKAGLLPIFRPPRTQPSALTRLFRLRKPSRALPLPRNPRSCNHRSRPRP